jgi:hypothetical protein
MDEACALDGGFNELSISFEAGIHISSRFDVRDQVDVTTVISRFEAIYEAMFRGYKQYFSGVGGD